MVLSRRHVVRLALLFPFAAAVHAAAQESPRFYVVGFIKTPGSYVLKEGMRAPWSGATRCPTRSGS
jgi:hypothetical protein